MLWAWFFSPMPLSMFSFFLFLHSPCPFSWILWRERSHMELYFCGMDRWYNANFQCRSIARAYGGAHESWSWKHEKNSHQGHNSLTKLNTTTSSCVKGFQDNSSYGFGRTLAYKRGALQRVFKFSNKISKHSNI
jgi:hypothetical protein